MPNSNLGQPTSTPPRLTPVQSVQLAGPEEEAPTESVQLAGPEEEAPTDERAHRHVRTFLQNPTFSVQNRTFSVQNPNISIQNPNIFTTCRSR